jgi:hypothetical protein
VNARTAFWITCLFILAIGVGSKAMPQDYNLEHRLESAAPLSSESVKVKFTLFNRGSSFVRIAAWNTPLGGDIRTRMFSVTCKIGDRDEPLAFQGPMQASAETAANQAPPGKSEQFLKNLIPLRPGQSVDATVDLATAYHFPNKGDCTVNYRGLITVVKELDSGVDTEPKLDFVRSRGEPLALKLGA